MVIQVTQSAKHFLKKIGVVEREMVNFVQNNAHRVEQDDTKTYEESSSNFETVAKELTDAINKLTIRDRIVFMLSSDYEAKSFIPKAINASAKYNEKLLKNKYLKIGKNYIVLFISPYFIYSLFVAYFDGSNETLQEIFDIFEYELSGVFHHELVHRVQNKKFSVGQGSLSKGSREKYLSDPREIMAHAKQIYVSLKMIGYEGQEILDIIKNPKKYEKVLSSTPFFDYASLSNKSVLNKLYKYIYEYVVGNTI